MLLFVRTGAVRTQKSTKPTVILIRLCGYHPFDPEGECSDNEMIANIKSCRFDFDDEGWSTISSGAKDLVRHLLVLDPEDRYSMDEVLAHPWISGDPALPPSEFPLSPTIHRDLARFREQSKQKAQVSSCSWTNCIRRF